MLQVDVGEVEVDTFHEHVARHQHLLVGIVHDGTVVTYTIDGGSVLVLISFGEVVDETKLTQLCYIQFIIYNL